MSLSSFLQGVLPQTAAGADALDQAAQGLGYTLSVPDFGGLRTEAQQTQLQTWEQQSCATGQGCYAVAPPGSSFHECGAAFDVQIVSGGSSDADYRALADLAPSVGLRAGYYFAQSDPFHFELPMSLAQACQLYNQQTTGLAIGGSALALVLLGVVVWWAYSKP